MKEESRMRRWTLLATGRMLMLLAGGFVLTGCVLSEKYEAEKARSLNFQRLLAQEEKRTGELDSEVKRTKQELTEYETRNRELTAQVQALREQIAHIQEEADAAKEAALLEKKARAEMKKAETATMKPRPADVPPSISELLGTVPTTETELAGIPSMSEMQSETKLGPTIHVVKPGETLYRISRRYGVKVDMLRKWNNLPDDIIEVGQKLIVSEER